MRNGFLAYIDPNNRPDLTGAQFIQQSLCGMMQLLPADAADIADFKKNATEPEKLHYRVEENRLINGMSVQFVEHLKAELKKYSNGLNDYAKYLNSMLTSDQTPLTESARKTVQERLDAVARWQKEVGAVYARLKIPPTMGEEAVQVLRNETSTFAVDQTVKYVRNILEFEWRRGDADFNRLYRCQ
jgi:ribosome-associated translation inhibitor RaiA